MSHAAAARYRSTQATTASRERLLVLLLETAQRRMREGAEALEAGKGTEGSVALGKAAEIVVELLATLDRARAPELVDSLARVYQFVWARLSSAQLQGDARAAREAERAIGPIVEGFSQAVASLGSP